MDDAKIRIRIISDLLDLYPARQDVDRKTVFAGYAQAIEQIPVMYVGEAARRLNAGQIERRNPSFAPSPTELANAARSIWHKELDREARQRDVRRQLEATSLKRSPEQCAHRREQVDRLLAGLSLGGADGRMAETPGQTRARAVQELHELSQRPREAPEITPELARMLGQESATPYDKRDT